MPMTTLVGMCAMLGSVGRLRTRAVQSSQTVGNQLPVSYEIRKNLICEIFQRGFRFTRWLHHNDLHRCLGLARKLLYDGPMGYQRDMRLEKQARVRRVGCVGCRDIELDGISFRKHTCEQKSVAPRGVDFDRLSDFAQGG